MASYRNTAAERLEPLSPVILKAPLFGALVGYMHTSDKRWVVLDLGPAQAGTISFFNQFRCRLDIADLPPHIEELNAEEDKQRLHERVQALLPASRGEPVDVVLCWDLLNYLNRPAMTALMESIAARSHTGTFTHALIVYSGTRMPALPGPYIPYQNPGDESESANQLTNMPLTAEEKEAPRYTPDDLAHCMRDYHIERAKLLSNGMQEFLFRI